MGLTKQGWLSGTFYATDDLTYVQCIPDGMAKIISLDEENTLNPNDPNVIVGVCLLPPIESLIAEADGDEDLYDIYYINHLNSPYLQEFIGALIAALYRGKNLLIYAPQMKENISIRKLRQHMWSMYGIGIGICGLTGTENCIYDAKCIPIWLNMLYSANVIDPLEFLLNYPNNAQFNNIVMDKLIFNLKPVGNCYKDRIDFILDFQQKLKENPRTKQAIFDLR